VRRFCAIAFAAVALVFTIGCGGGQKGLELKVGDKLVVTKKLERERFEAHYGANAKEISHTDGNLIQIPEGTVLEVAVTPRSDAHMFEVIPVKAGDITDSEELRNMFIQERYITHDFLFYTITIPSAHLDSSWLKKID
jgi:hypothetical protein